MRLVLVGAKCLVVVKFLLKEEDGLELEALLTEKQFVCAIVM